MASPSESACGGVAEWPERDLENVDACPVCTDGRRTQLYGGLLDRVFRAAPGRWTIWLCDGCGTGYLSPRPTEASIGLAYRGYYTHDRRATADWLTPAEHRFGRLVVSCVNGRLQARLGYRRTPSTSVGARVLPLFVRRDRELLARLRFVAMRPHGRLLDVGCGDGDYLRVMRSLLWEVTGVDPDPTATAAACEAGLDVRLGTLAEASFPSARFDVVTLCHVLEHVHDPIDLLAECRRVLAPGGELIIITPNLAGDVHRRFRGDWLHLDPPRHLAIFTIASLRHALACAGFDAVEQLPVRLRAGPSARASDALRSETDPTRRHRLGPGPWTAATLADIRAWHDPAHAEELALRAVAPG